MSWVLVRSPQGANVFADKRVVKAKEVRTFEDAASLLTEAEAILNQARAEAAAIRDAAHRAGAEQALHDVRDEMAQALAELASKVSAEGRQRDDELAEAAMAAVETMLGAGGVDAVGRALVMQALESFVGDQAVTVTVSPALAERLRAEMRAEKQEVGTVTVVADPARGPLEAELKIGSGTIDISAATQLAALADRWGAEPRAAA